MCGICRCGIYVRRGIVISKVVATALLYLNIRNCRKVGLFRYFLAVNRSYTVITAVSAALIFNPLFHHIIAFFKYAYIAVCFIHFPRHNRCGVAPTAATVNAVITSEWGGIGNSTVLLYIVCASIKSSSHLSINDLCSHYMHLFCETCISPVQPIRSLRCGQSVGISRKLPISPQRILC